MKLRQKAFCALLLALLLTACSDKRPDQNQSVSSDSAVSSDETVPESDADSIFVTLPDGRSVAQDLSSLTLPSSARTVLSDWQKVLKQLPDLEELRFEDIELTPQEFLALRNSTSAQIIYTPEVLGKPLDLSAEVLSLEELQASEIEAYLGWLPLMSELRELKLGEEDDSRGLTWENILSLEQASPDALPDYSFTLYGKKFNLSDTALDLNHKKMNDRGELVKRVARCMPALELIDMDFCGVENEDMAAIREEFPSVKVVWRVFFGMTYTCRTDVEKILASWPAAGLITDYNCSALKYCTEVKYLDIGHNWSLTDISFIASMPKLEVCILAYLQNLTDISAFANCPHLEYLELMLTNVSDVSALGGLKELRHVNFVRSPVEDITSLYDLDLERLYLGFFCKVPEAQIEEMRQRHPDVEIDLSAVDVRAGAWRGVYVQGECQYVDRYILLKEQFGYHYPDDYALKDGDPLFNPHD